MFEDIRHDPEVKKREEEINERPFDLRFGTNENIMKQRRENREKGKKAKLEEPPPSH